MLRSSSLAAVSCEETTVHIGTTSPPRPKTAMARSSVSSFADDYYNYASDAQSDDSYHVKPDSFPLPPKSVPQSHPQPGVKKQTSLAQISVPSFSAFRSQTSGIPITATRNRGSLLPSPRPTSFSAAEQASPRIAEPASRPLSLDSPLPRHPSGLAYILTPPLTTETVGKRERCVGHSMCCHLPRHKC